MIDDEWLGVKVLFIEAVSQERKDSISRQL
jgi:hypothetical protein